MNLYHYVIYLGVYTLGHIFFVFATLADGHGTFLFASTLIGWILFGVAVMLIPLSQSKSFFIAVVTCVMVYYIASCVIAVIEQTGEGNFQRTMSFLHDHTILFAMTGVWYIAGQVVFWFLLLERKRRQIAP